MSCPKCRAGGEPVFHLHCSYCDEILTGSIAQPGGKVADHVITIRCVPLERHAAMIRYLHAVITRLLSRQARHKGGQGASAGLRGARRGALPCRTWASPCMIPVAHMIVNAHDGRCRSGSYPRPANTSPPSTRSAIMLPTSKQHRSHLLAVHDVC